MELSQDGVVWGRSLTVSPGSTVQARVVATYDGPDRLYGLAWVNFQPRIAGWLTGIDTLEPFVSTGNQQMGMVAYDKPQAGQAAYGRIFPFAAVSMGAVAGGQNTGLTAHNETVTGRGALRIAQARTTNAIGSGSGTGQFSYNNTNGAGGIVCSQLTSESGNNGVTSFASNRVVLFAFAFNLNAFTTNRSLSVDLPLGGVSTFGQPVRSAGWFSSPAQSALAITYVPVRTRAAELVVQGGLPAPGVAAVPMAMLVGCALRRRRGV